MTRLHRTVPLRLAAAVVFGMFALGSAGPGLRAQSLDADQIRKLVQRVDQLERELAEVKGNVAVAQPDAGGASYPRLRFNGFTDVTYHATNAPGEHHAFTLGEFDLFVNSRISENSGVLAETVLAADELNHFSVDIERLIFQYRVNDALNVNVGRYHTAIGAYNTTYHHGTWFQTAVGRPSWLQYEDAGGLIPVHSVGISLDGAIPSGGLGLHYAAEIGNGRPYHDPAAGRNAVNNVIDRDGGKAVNFALNARPTAWPGVQVGAGFYHDSLSPDGQRRTDEAIWHGHALFKDAAWEIFAEAVAITHRPEGGRSTNSTAWFAQVSRGFGVLRPYVRYTAQDVPVNDGPFALLGLTGRHEGPSFGLRWDLGDYAAYKVQLARAAHSDRASTNELTLQVALTF